MSVNEASRTKLLYELLYAINAWDALPKGYSAQCLEEGNSLPKTCKEHNGST